MIFDSKWMAELYQKYAHLPLYEAPRIVRLAQNPCLAVEREYLEATLQCATGAKQTTWCAGLLADQDDGKHFGTWFEMMLYGWLQQAGKVEIEPIVEGDNPDFAVTAGSQRVIIEAVALTMGDTARMHGEYIRELIPLLEASPEPYEVYIEKVVHPARHPGRELADEMLQALGRASREAESELLDDEALGPQRDRERYHSVYCKDKHGTEVSFMGRRKEGLSRTEAFPPSVGFMNSKRAWEKLLEKTGQHEELRKAGYPYIIAMLLDTEAMFLDPKEAAAEVVLGRPGALIDQGVGRIVDWQWDRSGVLFADEGRGIRHLDVSGVLVFEAKLNCSARRRELKAWYVQNPYATAPVQGCPFPAEDRLVVLRQTPRGYLMGWASRPDTGFWLPPEADGARPHRAPN